MYCGDDIRAEYDNYVEKNNSRVLKNAGLATAVGISIVSLITGLALGLKRTGKDIEVSAKTHTWSPIGPGKKVPEEWMPLVPEITGHVLVFLGDNIYLVVGEVAMYAWGRKR